MFRCAIQHVDTLHLSSRWDVLKHAFLLFFFISHTLQAVFSRKGFQSPLKPLISGYKLEDYVIGNQIGKGSNGAVYEAAAPFAPLTLREDEDEEETACSLACCSLKKFPLAIKMMWNFGVSVLQCSSCLFVLPAWETSADSDHWNPFICRQDRPVRPY